MKARKVVLIAPVRPFRGGIAHSATILAENLAKNNDLLVVSWSKMFPKCLYKGKFQKENIEHSKKFKTEFLLDSMNPLTWQKTLKRIQQFEPEVVIFEWWTTTFSFLYYYLAFHLKTKARISVVCQNVLPHEKSLFDIPLTKLFFSQAKSFTCLDSSSELKLRRLIGLPKLGIGDTNAITI